MNEAAVGFSDHSGWAVAAVVIRAGETYELVTRRRIPLCPEPLPRQAYHAVAEQGAPRAVVREVMDAAASMARDAIAALQEESLANLRAAAVAHGRTAVPPELDRVLASHTLLHAAEGELYRDALAEGAAANALRIVRFLNKEVRSEAAAALGWPLATLEARLAEIGALAGRPWTKDEKDATSAAMLALATITG